MAEARAYARLAIASTIALGLIAGLLSGWWAITGGMGGKNYAGWYGSSVTGSADAGPWLRARVAVSGLLALNKSQAIYFTRKTDDAGQALREGCQYKVSGGAMPGRWWSVTVYAADNFLPRNDDDALSFDATEVTPAADGRWSALLSPARPQAGAWASTRNAGSFDITLRIYQPTAAAQQDFATIPMPEVTRLDCKGAA
ncbi:DUF1214 domain-containing protein [Novosphingobium sp.]|uniref:DUF1214 domain-containing protein n=1 Tax=Novosphingobium sp. TaxID=1874826 RepID=UPI00286A4B56|nr:DUF1214 domain-containing protein [Novosphingobium sp.]